MSRGAADCSEYRQAAGVVASKVTRVPVPIAIASGYEAVSRSAAFIYNIDQSCAEPTKSPPLISGGYMFNRRALIAAIAVGLLVVAPHTYAQDKSIVVASTTSTQDSGLFEYLLPIFKEKTGIIVKVL